MTPGRWIVPLRRTPEARVRLFCFPHAGAGASAFRAWSGTLPAGVDVLAIQAPGREARLAEAPFQDLAPLVSEVAGALGAYDDCPMAFFGHSLGAIVAFEVVRELQRRGSDGPIRLFVCACRAPHQAPRSSPINGLPDANFLAELGRLGGTPHEILGQDELMGLLLPGLRADFRLAESYLTSTTARVECPISAFGGREDPEVTAENLAGWALHTTAGFQLRLFPGAHFFIFDGPVGVVDALAIDLLASLVGETRP
jgi:surfactin synthase thioesterase subunit